MLQTFSKIFLKKYQKTLAILKWLWYYDRAREGRDPIFLCPDASRYAMMREVAALGGREFPRSMSDLKPGD
jgi:hypothetical protein